MRALETADLLFIVMAARWTVLLSLVAFLGGGFGGALIALARTSKRKWLRLVSTGYIKVFQGTPLLMQLFLAFFVPGLFGWSVEPWAAAAIGLSLNASAFLGEIWRGCSGWISPMTIPPPMTSNSRRSTACAPENAWSAPPATRPAQAYGASF